MSMRQRCFTQQKIYFALNDQVRVGFLFKGTIGDPINI